MVNYIKGILNGKDSTIWNKLYEGFVKYLLHIFVLIWRIS